MAQGQRNKKPGGAKNADRATPQASSSRVSFYVLIAALTAIGAGGIYYKMHSAPKPIVLSDTAIFPKSEGYLLGNPNAPVTIIEFADFECEQCANFSTVTEPDVRKRIIETGLANMRFYDFPLTDKHPNSVFASLAASCAAEQGKFWQMHDTLMFRQGEWQGHTQSNPNPVPQFESYAKQVGLEMGKYDACFKSRENVAKINAHYKAGLEFQVPATPSFVIGGTLHAGSQPYDVIKRLVDLETMKIKAHADSGKER
ncbi:MAG: thioredoxin domain-containing protein [Gemmatimonas sp.]